MEILQKSWIRKKDLKELEKNMFIQHYKSNENVVILCGNKNLEYKITNIDKDNIYLEWTGKIYK